MLTRLAGIVLEALAFDRAVGDWTRFFARDPDPIGAGPEQSVVFRVGSLVLELRAASAGGPGGERVGGEGIRGLRLAFDPDGSGRFRSGRPEGLRLPIELVPDVGAPDDGLASDARNRAASPIIGLDHVVLTTEAPERMRRDLAETLGLRLALDRRFPERGLRLLFFRLGGVTLEVAASTTADAAEQADPDAASTRPDGFGGLAWRVAGLDALAERLGGAGFDLSPPRPGHKPGTRVCTVRSPVHGVPTLLIEHPPRSG